MSEVRLTSVTKRYGEYVAVNSINLTVHDGEFLTILGPSGCGKTTTLRMVAGFVLPDAGTVHIGSSDVSSIPSYRRNTGMVFQSYALFPHLTVEENVAYGLHFRKLPKVELQNRVNEALDLVQLRHLAKRYPRQMSGGQQQRVALARAVAIKPDILLLDEPIGALDLKLRQELQVEIKRVQETLKITTLYVTHDQGEALSLSDRIAVMHSGKVLQLDSPTRLYNHPKNAFVANFIGKTNILPVIVVSHAGSNDTYVVKAYSNPELLFYVQRHADDAPFEVGTPCLLAFRPERALLNHDRPNRITARVEKVTYFGSTWTISLQPAMGSPMTLEHRMGENLPDPGAEVVLTWSPSDCFLLAKEDDVASSN